MPNIVYSYYALDIIHSGHILMMKNSKALAGKDGKLIVGILTDKAVMEKKKRPILPFEERMRIAQAIKYVDLVVAQETYSPIDNIKAIKPNIMIESISHSEKEREEVRKLVESWGGKLITLPYYPSYSSTNIKKEIVKNDY